MLIQIAELYQRQPGRPPANPDDVRAALWRGAHQSSSRSHFGQSVRAVYSISADGTRTDYTSLSDAAKSIGMVPGSIGLAIKLGRHTGGRRWFYTHPKRSAVRAERAMEARRC